MSDSRNNIAIFVHFYFFTTKKWIHSSENWPISVFIALECARAISWTFIYDCCCLMLFMTSIKKTSREWEKATAKSELEKEPVYVSVIKRFNWNWADCLYVSRVTTPSYCILCIHAVRTHFLPSTITQTNGPVILFTESTDRRIRRKIILTDTLWAWTWQSLSTSVASQ